MYKVRKEIMSWPLNISQIKIGSAFIFPLIVKPLDK